MSDTRTRPVFPTPALPDIKRLDLEAHGTRSTYRRGCRCLLCRVASARVRGEQRWERRKHPRYADAPQGV